MYIALDFGATELKSGVFDESGNIRLRHRCSTAHVRSQTQLLEILIQQVETLIKKIEAANKDMSGIGVGIPGFVPSNVELIPLISNLGVRDIKLTTKLNERFGCKVVVENDANVAAWGENQWGAAQNYNNILMITLGTGVGGGIILDNKIIRGKLGLAGEIGHMQVRPCDGRLCNCGKIGCLETESSGSAIAYYASLAFNEEKTAREVVELAEKGNVLAKKLVDNASYYLSLALANALHLLEFDRIIIGGGVALGGQIVMRPVQYYMQQFLTDAPQFNTGSVVLSDLGDDAGLYGLFSLLTEPSPE